MGVPSEIKTLIRQVLTPSIDCVCLLDFPLFYDVGLNSPNVIITALIILLDLTLSIAQSARSELF